MLQENHSARIGQPAPFLDYGTGVTQTTHHPHWRRRLRVSRVLEEVLHILGTIKSQIVLDAIQGQASALGPDGKVIPVWRKAYRSVPSSKFIKVRQTNFVCDPERFLYSSLTQRRRPAQICQDRWHQKKEKESFSPTRKHEPSLSHLCYKPAQNKLRLEKPARVRGAVQARPPPPAQRLEHKLACKPHRAWSPHRVKPTL